jgi:glycerate-2-kinase
MKDYDLKELGLKIVNSAIQAVKPDRLIQKKVVLKANHLTIEKQTFDLDKFEKIFIVGTGKASALMAREMENLLKDRIFYGVVCVKYGHSAPCRKVRIQEAAHPVIDENGLQATAQILQTVKGAGEKDLVICLLSGGGSALLEYLPEGISLQDLQTVFKLLLESGANIEEMNVVRRHLSQVKGGQLAREIYPATCLSLILSDVIGDPLESIASGPTAPDPSTFQDAWEILDKYKLTDRLPETIHQHLEAGLQRKIEDTVKAGDPVFDKVHNFIIGSNLGSLKAAEKTARSAGFNTLILNTRIQGEAREIARVCAAIAQELNDREIPLKLPACVLMGGETTVTIRGKGKGGRNQELALAAMMAMKNVKADYLIVSCGTDGTDGPTDAAGGFASSEILGNAEKLGLNPAKFLEQNNAYPFLEKTSGLIKTGPTGTNVMDIIAVLVK